MIDEAAARPGRRRALGAMAAAACWPLPSRAGDGPRPLRVVASFSILADMAQAIAGPAAAVSALVGRDADAHVFEPTPADARRVADADVVIVNGLRFEGWIERLVRASGFRGPVVAASAGVAPRRLGNADDPHAWQSLANARRYADNIEAALAAALPPQRSLLGGRADAYRAAIETLDRSVRASFAAVPRARRRVVTSHDAFGYFGDAYGIDFLAAQGLSTQSDPSAAAVARLAGEIRRLGVRAIFVENVADPRLVERLAREGGARAGGKLYSDALSAPGTVADTYLRMFAHNAATIAAGLRSA